MNYDPRDDWYVEIGYSNWRRLCRWVSRNRKDILIVAAGILVLAALILVGPPVCGGMT